MRLGWYARLAIVLMVFWTVGKGYYEHNQDRWIGIEAQAGDLTRCLDSETRNIPFTGKLPGEDCNAYAARQFPWQFGWSSLSDRLMQSGVQAVFWGLLSIILYWAGRWVLAGRKPNRQTPDQA